MRAETAEAGHHLVGDQQDVVLVQDRLDRLPVTGRRRHDAAGAQNRLADEGGDRVGAFALDQRLQLGGAMGGEILLAHRGVLAAEIIGRLGVKHLGSGRSNWLWNRPRPVSDPVIRPEP